MKTQHYHDYKDTSLDMDMMKDMIYFHVLKAAALFRIKLYFTLVLKTINISFKLSVTNGNKKKHITIKFIK